MALLNQTYGRARVQPPQEVLYSNEQYPVVTNQQPIQQETEDFASVLQSAAAHVNELLECDDAVATLEAELERTNWLLLLITQLQQAKSSLTRRQKILTKSLENLKNLTYGVEELEDKPVVTESDLDTENTNLGDFQ